MVGMMFDSTTCPICGETHRWPNGRWERHIYGCCEKFNGKRPDWGRCMPCGVAKGMRESMPKESLHRVTLMISGHAEQKEKNA